MSLFVSLSATCPTLWVDIVFSSSGVLPVFLSFFSLPFSCSTTPSFTLCAPLYHFVSVLFCLFRRPFSPLNFLLCSFTPCPWRAVLSLSNVYGLAEAAEPAGSARLGALCAALEAGSRLQRTLSGGQPFFPLGLRPDRRVPGAKHFLQVFFKEHPISINHSCRNDF